MKYKNTTTGAIISSASKIRGGDWVAVSADHTSQPESAPARADEIETIPDTETEPIKEAPENLDDFDGITVKQIKQELDAFGADYNPRAKKQDLYDQMMKLGK